MTKADNTLISEGLALSKRMYDYFYEPSRNQFAARYPSSDTTSPDNGYYVWPVAVAVEAIVEAERNAPGQFTQMLDDGLAAMEVYWSKEFGAYCAWHDYPGNDDIYYDDNAQIAIAQIGAYEVTENITYLNRAIAVVKFILTGWDDTDSPGGVLWHRGTSPTAERNACSTAETATACLRLAQIKEGVPADLSASCIDLGEKATVWLLKKLQDKDGLIRDGLSWRDGSWQVNPMKWTYNTGSTLSALSLLYKMKPSSDIRRMAIGLATSAIDASKALFDLTVANPETRYWWDSTFFSQLLVEGLVLFIEVFDQEALGDQRLDQKLAEKVRNEVIRQTLYVKEFLRDDVDGLYFRSLRLYTIGQAQLDSYRKLTGDRGRQLEADAGERENGQGDVAQRRLVKTILGSGGVARGMLLAGSLLSS
ncbi:MAG: hypothetical protein M1812_000071 [Candelaria pacifica]|nr:MAG: hypothetical protein M1812_000071 [Candelaria pacifica]